MVLPRAIHTSKVFIMYKQQKWPLLIAFALLLILVRYPSFEIPLDTDSSANAFLARQMLRGESLYGKFHPGHHLPGIYYTFELAFRLFGDNDLAPKLLLIPWALACAWLIYLMGRSFFDEQIGFLGAIFFILVSSQEWVTGLTVEMEHFANLPLIAGVLLNIVLIRTRAPAWQYVWIGILGAISILYKVTFVAPLMAAGLSILALAWIQRHAPGVWKTMFLQLIWLTTGLMLSLAFVAGYFASLGLWERFTLVFRFGSIYFNNPDLMGASWLPRPFGFPLFWMSLNNIALLIFGLIGAYRLTRRALPMQNTGHLTDFVLVLWLVASLALAGLRGGGFAHYLLPVIPPLALMAAIEISMAHERWKTTTANKNFATLGAGFFVSLIVINFILGNNDIYSQYAAYRLDRISYDNFLRNSSEGGYASQAVAKYVKAHTDPNDFVYAWSIYMDLFYYADRLPPIDILWPSFVSATGSPERIFDPNTKYIVLDKPERYKRPQWLMDGLAANYFLETTVEGWEIYRRQ